MEKEKILMGQTELKRWHLIELGKVGKITLMGVDEITDAAFGEKKGTPLPKGGDWGD